MKSKNVRKIKKKKSKKKGGMLEEENSHSNAYYSNQSYHSNQGFIETVSKIKKIYIVWIRHCVSCANNAQILPNQINNRFFKEPLCDGTPNDTKLTGIEEPYIFGREFRENINGLPKTLEYYSSILPRAMQTMKLITKGVIDSKRITEDGITEDDINEINRMDYIHEEANIMEKNTLLPNNITTQNTTNLAVLS